MTTQRARKLPTATSPRWYDDACGMAHALELVGERWALLVVRELLFGPRRFSELRAGLPGISANVLTQRLESLIAAGIAVRRELPSASYELTAWGYEAEPAIRALGRWAARSPTHDPTLPVSAVSVMLSFRTMFDRARVRGLAGRVGVRLDHDAFVAEVNAEELAVRRSPIVNVRASIATTPQLLVALAYGGRKLADAREDGSALIEGDVAFLKRFLALFVLPPKAQRP